MALIPEKYTSSKPTPAQIRAQSSRILASKGFSRSERLCKFLGYVVSAALDGQSDRLKEFTLGIEVFDRDDCFDPGIDSIVRVEASRLRSKLVEYYIGEGCADAVRISIPKGHYVPEFCHVEDRTTRPPTPQLWQSWREWVFGTIILSVAAVAYWLPQTEPAQVVSMQQAPDSTSLAVLPLRDWSPLPEEYFSESVTNALISSLAEKGTLQVTSMTSVIQFKNTRIPIPEIGRALKVAYILEGGVVRDGERIRITARLIHTDSDQNIWAKTIDRHYSDLLTMQSGITTTIAAQINDEMLYAKKSIPVNLSHAVHTASLKDRFYVPILGEEFF